MKRKVHRIPITILKLGGATVSEPDDLERLALHVREIRDEERQVILVHGGGDEIAELHERLGVPFEKQRGLRVTPEESMPLVTMVLRGLVNSRIVSHLVAAEVPAIGLSGVDLELLSTGFLNRNQLGRVGGPPRVARRRLRSFLSGGLVPVIAPICLGPDNREVNVNADTVANSIAAALGADVLDFVTSVPGVKAEDSVLDRLDPGRVRTLLADGVATGGMVPKLQAALAAIDSGVSRVRIGNFDTLAANQATEVVA